MTTFFFSLLNRFTTEPRTARLEHTDQDYSWRSEWAPLPARFGGPAHHLPRHEGRKHSAGRRLQSQAF